MPSSCSRCQPQGAAGWNDTHTVAIILLHGLLGRMLQGRRAVTAVLHVAGLYE